jgi:hypothetical protein
MLDACQPQVDHDAPNSHDGSYHSNGTNEKHNEPPPLVAAFLVGMNPEWPYGRCSQGDVALCHAVRRFCRRYCDLYEKNNREDKANKLVQFVSEHDVTTVEALEDRLSSFLENIRAIRKSRNHGAIHLIFYLGGHGEPGYYCLPQDESAQNQSSKLRSSNRSSPRWCHREIVNHLDYSLTEPGDHVWMLVDTCYSGSFADVFREQSEPSSSTRPDRKRHDSVRGRRHRPPGHGIPLSSRPGVPNAPLLRSRANSELSYSILMSTARDSLAGPDWTLTDGWIQAMEGRLPRAMHNAPEGVTGEEATRTTQEVVDSIQDLIRRIKENEMQYLSVGPNDCSAQPFPFCFRNIATAANPISQLQAQSMDVKNVSTQLDSLTLEGDLTYSGVNPKNLSSQQIAHCVLARNGQYRDYSAYPAGTKLWILWEDHTRLYSATVLEDCDVPWESFYELPTRGNVTKHLLELPLPDMSGPMGPCIPVRWHKEQSYSFMPVRQCVAMPKHFPYRRRLPKLRMVRQQAQQAGRDEFHRMVSLTSSLPMDCLLRSFESAGKTLLLRWEDIRSEISLLSSSSSLVDEQFQFQWDPSRNKPWTSIYFSSTRRTEDPAGKMWKNVWLSSSIQSIDDLSMEVFISHLNYTERGSYCIISWNINETDLQATTTATELCVPIAFLRRAGETP